MFLKKRNYHDAIGIKETIYDSAISMKKSVCGPLFLKQAKHRVSD